MSLSISQIQSTLAPYQLPISGDAAIKIRTFTEILIKWDRMISLTTVTDPLEIIKFHFGESIFAVSGGLITQGRLADVGSGAGFPGLAIKLVLPHLRVVLIEPNKKKCAFLHEIVRALEFEEVDIIAAPFQESRINSVSLDYVASRALRCTQRLFNWAGASLAKDGSLLLWIGEEDYAKISSVRGWRWDSPVRLPGTKNRLIVSGNPI